jgi:hypothetical protein
MGGQCGSECHLGRVPRDPTRLGLSPLGADVIRNNVPTTYPDDLFHDLPSFHCAIEEEDFSCHSAAQRVKKSRHGRGRVGGESSDRRQLPSRAPSPRLYASKRGLTAICEKDRTTEKQALMAEMEWSSNDTQSVASHPSHTITAFENKRRWRWSGASQPIHHIASITHNHGV